MRIAFFTPYPEEGPSARFRIYQFVPLLRESGIHCDVFPFLESSEYKYIFLDYKKNKKIILYLRSLLKRRKQFRHIHTYDVVFIHLNVCPFGMYFENLILRKKNPIIFDFDDADFLKHNSAINIWSTIFKNPAKTVKMIQQSHLVIAGNSYLADYAKKYNKNVFIIPTSLDTQKYKQKNRMPHKERIVIGWIGSAASSIYLPSLNAVFRELLNKYKNIEIVIIGSKNYRVPDSRITLRPWTLETELSDLQEIDIGLMPLTDDEYSKGKCGFKALQYMSVGTATVVSPVGVNMEIIIDGINGFTADCPQEWISKIGVLIENTEVRNEMGNAARKTVEEKYSIAANSKKLMALLEQLHQENKKN